MSKGKSKTGLYAAIAIIVIIIVVVGVVVALMYKPGSTGTPLTMFAGEVSTAAYGFGNTANSITSPGPTITLKEGTSYTMTVTNSGTMPHAWEITMDKTSSIVLWGAQIDPTSYISPGASGSVTFTPTETGTFYYICPVPGHVALGMWGTVIVTA